MQHNLFWFFLFVFATVSAYADPKPPRIVTVIATTDFHGSLEPEVTKTTDGIAIEAGGAPLLAAYVKAIRAQAKGPVVHLDGGDLFQGSLASNLAEGVPVVRFYNSLHVTAAALGNHEFDFGPVGPNAVPRDPGDDPQGAIKERTREARFPFLAANVVDDDGKTPSWLRRSFIFKRDGLRIGIVGAATPETPDTTIRANLAGLHFLPPLESVRCEAEALREKEHVDLVLFTFHGGAGCEDNTPTAIDDLSTCKDGEIFRLLSALPEGLIDVAVGGHTHQGVAKRIGKTLVLQSYSKGQRVGWAEVPVGKGAGVARIVGFTPVCGSIVDSSIGPTCSPKFVLKSRGPAQPVTFFGKLVVPDPQTVALIAPDLERVRRLKQRSLGIRALDSIERSYFGESALGNLTADILRQAIKGSDVGMTNGGGLRTDLPPGPLKYGHIFNLVPFDNHLATITATGKQVVRMVELGHAGAHGGLSWSNLSFEAKDCEVRNIQINGQPLNLEAEYHLVTNEYLVSGGSGFDKLGLDPSKMHVLWDAPYIMRDVMAKSLHDGKKDIKAGYYYDPTSPRQRVTGTCDHVAKK